jgi:hypothetical protein
VKCKVIQTSKNGGSLSCKREVLVTLIAKTIALGDEVVKRNVGPEDSS